MAGRIAVEDCFADALRTVLAMPGGNPAEPVPNRTDLALDALMDRTADLRAPIDAIGRGPAWPTRLPPVQPPYLPELASPKPPDQGFP